MTIDAVAPRATFWSHLTPALAIQVFAIVGVGGGGWATLNYRVTSIETARLERRAEVNDQLRTLRNDMGQFSSLPYRMGQAESAIAEGMRKQDKLQDTIVTALELIRKEVGSTSTRVEVLSSKIDLLAGQTPGIAKP